LTAIVNIERLNDPYTVQVVAVENGQETVLHELKAGEKVEHVMLHSTRTIILREKKE
jgi:hypothetical protein